MYICLSICVYNQWAFNCAYLFVACSGLPCKYPATCVDGATTDDYVCVCPEGYSGTNCDTVAGTWAPEYLPAKKTMEKIITLTWKNNFIHLGFILLNWLCNRFISIFGQCSKDKLLSSGRFFVLNKHVVLDNGYLRISDDQIYENLIWLSYSNGHSYGQFWRRFYYVDDAWLNRGRF